MRSIPVEDVMTVDVEATESNSSAVEVAKTMTEEEIGSVVVTEDGEATGIVCERDMLDKVVAADARPGELTAGNIMEVPLSTVELDADLLDAIRLMVRNDIGHLPVVENGALVGILTVQDVLKAMPEFLETLPNRREVERRASETAGESVCEVCGEVRKSLIEHDGRWICEECLDFLTG